MYLVQTVSSGPARPWSSYTDITAKEALRPGRMNSTEDITTYNDHNSHYCSPVLARRATKTYEIIEKSSPKKDKKWSIGNLFRRKKKNESDSSSEDEAQKKNFLQRRKKKSDKRKKPIVKPLVTFDHVVIPPGARSAYTFPNGYRSHEDSLCILSEPSYTAPRTRYLAKSLERTNDLLSRVSQDNKNGSHNSLESGSVDSLGKRTRRGRPKTRGLPRRDTTKPNSSSDEDSQISAFRSDDSLSKQRDSSLSRKSRGARTERYMRRLSKDDELIPLRTCKSDIENRHVQRNKVLAPIERVHAASTTSRSPILSAPSPSKLSYANSAPIPRPTFSGLSTIPPSHNSFNKYKTINSVSNYSQKPNNANTSYVYSNAKRSQSCDTNIHKAIAPEGEIISAQFNLGIPVNMQQRVLGNHNVGKQPPPPPPRDPRRIFTVQQSDGGRPISYSFEHGFPQVLTSGAEPHANKKIAPHPPTSLLYSVNNPETANLHVNGRSTSDDHISCEPIQRVSIAPRPSSATPEAKLQSFARKKSGKSDASADYRYLTDKHPRSRRPIFIQSCNNAVSTGPAGAQPKPQKTLDFWRQKVEDERNLATRILNNSTKPTATSPQMFVAQTQVRTNVFLPSGRVEENHDSKNNARESSPFRPITPTVNGIQVSSKGSANNVNLGLVKHSSVDSLEDELGEIKETQNRKSSNLEDALDELEAIYNSLHLGDEDLLDRAEQREAAAAQQRREMALEAYPESGLSRGAISDSSFGFDSHPRRKRYSKQPVETDRKGDDMAYRKLNKERSKTINDPQSAMSRGSYLLSSPIFTSMDDPQPHKTNTKEPDVTYDDVVYRNIKHMNNTLKVVEPQPLFGIPLGPISPAANSDYLHATPEVTPKLIVKPRKIPDVVTDDLAYRNLRKDYSKEAGLPAGSLNQEDVINNNDACIDDVMDSFKKKRAIRSLSANIYNLMKNDSRGLIPTDNDSEKEQSLADVADAMEIARSVLKDKENKINATRKAFLSDGDTKYVKGNKKTPGTSTETLTDSRTNFLNEMKAKPKTKSDSVKATLLEVAPLEGKPPTPERRRSKSCIKESTPTPSSPVSEISGNSTLDELLTALAVEARETSDRITDELNQLSDEKKRRSLLKLEDELTNFGSLFRADEVPTSDEAKRGIDDVGTSLLSKQLSEIDSTSEHAKLCEKLLECVVESTDLISSLKIEPSEEAVQIKLEPMLSERVANLVVTHEDTNGKEDEKRPVITEIYSESDHDYVNIESSLEEIDALLGGSIKCNISRKNPELIDLEEFGKNHIAPLFDEVDGARRLEGPADDDDDVDNYEEDPISLELVERGGGESSVGVECIAFPSKQCTFVSESHININPSLRHSFVSKCELDVSGDPEKDDNECGGDDTEPVLGNSKLSESSLKSIFLQNLESPRLVQILDSAFLKRCDTTISSVGGDFSNLDVVQDNKDLDASCSFLDTNGRRVSFSDHSDCNCADGGRRTPTADVPSREQRKNDDTNPPVSQNCDLLGRRLPGDSVYSRDHRQHTLNKTEASTTWYQDPAAYALACSSGIACSQQLSSLDTVTLLGLLFAVISLVVALFLRL